MQKVYEILLCQYEQIHHYRTPAKVSTLTGGNNSESLLGKRKSCDCCSRGDEAGKRKCIHDIYRASTGPGTPEKETIFQTSLDEKKIKLDLCAPQRAKTSYQLFVKMECQRLRQIHGEAAGSLNLRVIAIDAWRKLSKNERMPYIEASRKDKERFEREMAIYTQYSNKKIAKSEDSLNGSTSVLINFGPSSSINDDYHVTLDADDENFYFPDETLVESTSQMLKNRRPDDPIFQINWDGFCGSPDSPN